MEDSERAAVDRYFSGAAWSLPLFETIHDAVTAAAGPGGSLAVQKTQIAYRIGVSGGCRPLQFAFVWLPTRRIKGRPGQYLVLTFGLGRREVDPRIIESVEPYPGRFTHHMLLSSPADVDDTVRGWLVEAAAFAREKQQKSHGKKQ